MKKTFKSWITLKNQLNINFRGRGTDLSFYFSLPPNSRPIDQSSGVRSLSECYFYRMEVFMTNNFSSHDHLAVGVKFPNGTEQKPMSGNNLYWLKPGINLKFTFLTLF